MRIVKEPLETRFRQPPRAPRRARASIARAGRLLLAASAGLIGCAGCIGVSASRSAGGGASVGPVADEIKVCRSGTRSAPDGVIDDLEDGNTQVSLEGGRDGYWWRANDPLGSSIELANSEGGADGSEMAIRVAGSTATGADAWGVNFGLMYVSQKGATYDASKYAGVSFKAKVGPKSIRSLRFKVGDINTHKDADVCKTCWNHFGKDMTFSPQWREYRIMFADLRQADGWGDPRPPAVTPSKLVNLDWSISGGQAFEIWIDDVQFIDCK